MSDNGDNGDLLLPLKHGGFSVRRAPGFDPQTSSMISGEPSDAKFQSLAYTLAAGAETVFDVSIGQTVFVDTGSAVIGEIQMTFDTCSPWLSIARSMFIRVRSFRKLRLRNTTAGPLSGTIIVSNNPEFVAYRATA